MLIHNRRARLQSTVSCAALPASSRVRNQDRGRPGQSPQLSVAPCGTSISGTSIAQTCPMNHNQPAPMARQTYRFAVSVALALHIFGTAAGAAPPVPRLVKDLQTATLDSDPADFVTFNEAVYFTATDGMTGRSLYKTDGTAVGTTRVARVQMRGRSLDPQRLSVVGNRLFFVGRDTIQNRDILGVTDGTAAGTRLLSGSLLDRSDTAIVLLLTCGDRLVFLLSQRDGGIETLRLWASDGTDGGTQELSDAKVCHITWRSGQLIAAGSSGQLIAAGSSGQLIAAGGLVYFTVTAGEGRQLWRTDGTADGTVCLLERPLIPPAAWLGSTGAPAAMTAFGDRLCFVAADTEYGNEVWISDGTVAGTRRLTDVRPGATDANPAELTVVGNRLFFTADAALTADTPPPAKDQRPAIRSRELWQTDGTPEGTARVEELTLGPQSPNPAELTAAGDVLYLSADIKTSESQRGRSLWKLDPHDIGLVQAAPLPQGARLCSPAHLTPVGRQIYFNIDAREVWTSDGTADGTLPLSELTGGTTIRDIFGKRAVFGNRLLISSRQGDSVSLWSTDGTRAGTVRLPGDVWSVANRMIRMSEVEPLPHAVLDGHIYFAALDPVVGLEICKSDGTSAGTGPVADINRQAPTSFHGGLVEAGGLGWFQALTSSAQDGRRRRRLWRTDGTGKGTFPLDEPFRTLPSVVECQDALFLAGAKSHHALWRLDDGGLTTIAQFNQSLGSTPPMAVAGGQMFFTVHEDDIGRELYRSDGTTAGTQLLRDIAPDEDSSYADQFTPVGSLLYFTAQEFTAQETDQRNVEEIDKNRELWRTDGTPAGTVRVADLRPGSAGSRPRSLTVCGGRLYFIADDGTGLGIWVVDGPTAAPRQLVAPRPEVPNFQIGGLTTLGQTLCYMIWNDDEWELWRTQGTPATTERAALPPHAMQIVSSSPVAGCDGWFYFVGTSLQTGYELYRSDGTAAGTTLVADINPGERSSRPASFTVVGNVLTFTADDGNAGRELWQTDGTAAGTIRLGDIRPGSATSDPQPLGVAAGRFYFTADDGVAGRELWTIDPAPSQDAAD